jgi:hypothetical protein
MSFIVYINSFQEADGFSKTFVEEAFENTGIRSIKFEKSSVLQSSHLDMMVRCFYGQVIFFAKS